MAADTPTAHSILTSFLLTSTSYTLPSLPSLRSLDSRLPDSDLKQAHRELLQHRNGLRAQLQQNINQYQLLPKEAVQQLKRNAVNKREEEEGDEGEDEEYLTLEQVMQRLEQEEKELGAEVQELNGAVEDQKALLDALSLCLSLLALFASTNVF